ncbi:hypothetical protein [Streptomyces sp. NBC_01803]|uniref:hypothetical protein n=1 Tax=Streptomyces sp. NBC_01803 TaxID=2975946 RepID=UPI002DD99BB3|nr:hypothetical protein [Streptomyces sp. NBC_01803]WSA45874.1 hypothetical protein OIE51_17690 [Streptomyces sp. NBC_01803]
MARLRHTIVLEPIGRRRVDSAVGVVHDIAESVRADGDGTLIAGDGRPVVEVTLTDGEHLRPGARYGFTASGTYLAAAELLTWDRRRETGVRFDITEPPYTVPEGGETSGAVVSSVVRLRSAERPEHVELTVDGALTRPDGRRRRLRWFTLHGGLDLARWWDAVGGKPGGAAPGAPPLTLDIRHPILRAGVTAVPRVDAADGTWRLDVVITLRGRGLARPVAAVPLLVTRRVLYRAIGQALDRLADDWRAVLLPEIDREPAEFRRRLLDELCTGSVD